MNENVKCPIRCMSFRPTYSFSLLKPTYLSLHLPVSVSIYIHIYICAMLRNKNADSPAAAAAASSCLSFFLSAAVLSAVCRWWARECVTRQLWIPFLEILHTWLAGWVSLRRLPANSARGREAVGRSADAEDVDEMDAASSGRGSVSLDCLSMPMWPSKCSQVGD
ncbi:uncharacterized protein IWZ02DRAFT_67438 [Phyllosticta citriasiana]|uniref:uncharacterized protein n=1 Tax=Phyllosticta citriasiana TaxID=595635 RepID=UPI0030FD427E